MIWKIGRVGYCTGFENQRLFFESGGSNPSSSVNRRTSRLATAPGWKPDERKPCGFNSRSFCLEKMLKWITSQKMYLSISLLVSPISGGRPMAGVTSPRSLAVRVQISLTALMARYAKKKGKATILKIL